MRTHLCVPFLLLAACSKEQTSAKPVVAEPAAPATAPAAPPILTPMPVPEAVDNGGMVELQPYDGTDPRGALWMPGVSSGTFPTIDIVLLELGGKAKIDFKPQGGKRSSLPISIPADDLEHDSWMIEERNEHRVVIRISGITFGDVEGENEAYLVGWDDAKNAPVQVEHWKGTSADMPTWAIPAEG